MGLTLLTGDAVEEGAGRPEGAGGNFRPALCAASLGSEGLGEEDSRHDRGRQQQQGVDQERDRLGRESFVLVGHVRFHFFVSGAGEPRR